MGQRGTRATRRFRQLWHRLFPWRPQWKPKPGERERPMPEKGKAARKAAAAEDAVARYLWLRGYRIVARNVLSRAGEIDIVARKRNTLYIIEVRSYVMGNPRPSVGLSQDKMRRLLRAGQLFQRRRPELAACSLAIYLAEVCFTAADKIDSIAIHPLDYSQLRWR